MSTEISESVRRNLLWERQVNKPQVAGLPKRSMSSQGGMMSGGVLGGGLRPLTSTTSQAGQARLPRDQAPQAQVQGQESSADKGKGRASGDAITQAEKEYNERKKKAMARNRSWADDYHYSGW